MPINMNDFIFHSSRIPFGSIESKKVTLAIGGPVTMSGKIVLSEVIPISAKSISPRLVYTIPPGTWYEGVGGVIPSGTKVMAGSFRYVAAPYPNGREVSVRPFVKYVAGGIQVGVKMSMSYSGTNPGSVTVPATNLNMLISVDVIPQNTE